MPLKKQDLISIFAAGILIFLSACTSQITAVKINNMVIPVELATTPTQHEQGLMFRTNLTGGMLFVFPEEAERSFWMKNTLIPLDIIFIDEDNTIVKVHHADPCSKDPCKLYSANNTQYVLEVNQNFTLKNNIKENISIVFLH